MLYLIQSLEKNCSIKELNIESYRLGDDEKNMLYLNHSLHI